MAKFSANLGFLWTDRTLPDAIASAGAAGFKAVECHWPYEHPPKTIVDALDTASLPMLGLNTLRGNIEQGEAGLTALPGRESEAQQAIEQAINYAAATHTRNVHVMAGVPGGSKTEKDAANSCFIGNLRYASKLAAEKNVSLLIEPINQRDIPGYFLNTVELARQVINEVGQSNLKLMFDCYHVQITSGDLIVRLKDHLDIIGHIQIAAVPSRAEPDEGEVNYPFLIQAIDDMGYQGYIGAEYKPRLDTDSGLNWLTSYQH